MWQSFISPYVTYLNDFWKNIMYSLTEQNTSIMWQHQNNIACRRQSVRVDCYKNNCNFLYDWNDWRIVVRCVCWYWTRILMQCMPMLFMLRIYLDSNVNNMIFLTLQQVCVWATTNLINFSHFLNSKIIYCLIADLIGTPFENIGMDTEWMIIDNHNLQNVQDEINLTQYFDSLIIYKSNLNGWYTSDDRSSDLHGFALLQNRFRRLKSYFFNRRLLNLDDYVHYDANQNQINAKKGKSNSHENHWLRKIFSPI